VGRDTAEDNFLLATEDLVYTSETPIGNLGRTLGCFGHPFVCTSGVTTETAFYMKTQ